MTEAQTAGVRCSLSVHLVAAWRFSPVAGPFGAPAGQRRFAVAWARRASAAGSLYRVVAALTLVGGVTGDPGGAGRGRCPGALPGGWRRPVARWWGHFSAPNSRATKRERTVDSRFVGCVFGAAFRPHQRRRPGAGGAPAGRPGGRVGLRVGCCAGRVGVGLRRVCGAARGGAGARFRGRARVGSHAWWLGGAGGRRNCCGCPARAPGAPRAAAGQRWLVVGAGRTRMVLEARRRVPERPCPHRAFCCRRGSALPRGGQ